MNTTIRDLLATITAGRHEGAVTVYGTLADVLVRTSTAQHQWAEADLVDISAGIRLMFFPKTWETIDGPAHVKPFRRIAATGRINIREGHPPELFVTSIGAAPDPLADHADQQAACGCHRECTIDEHACDRPCDWPSCLSPEQTAALLAGLAADDG